MAIISFRHNFIFFKTTKTAGTSIEVDLSRHVEDSAIVTPITPPLQNHQPRNYLDTDGQLRFYNHMPASKICHLIGRHRFDNMFKFCVEREPVAKCISHFHMYANSDLHNQNGKFPTSWDEYCEIGRFPIDLARYTEQRNGRPELMVNRIIRYEHLAEELPTVLAPLGIPDFALISRAKSEYSRQVRITPEKVTSRQRDIIYEAFSETLSVTKMSW
ncbi:MAG: hypothetical protein GJ677_02340 [Rhodobacteraceae bacterium]|nr:hypothetical protein [Paracoccaceae bacterium]